MKFIFIPRFWLVLAVSIWVLLWLLFAASFVFKNNYDALWILAIFSIPSSTITKMVSEMINSLFTVMPVYHFYFDLVGFLLFGSLQYGLIGYIFGLGVKWLSTRVKSTV